MKREIRWHPDSNGMVLRPRVHDSHLSKLTLTERLVLDIHMRRSDSTLASLEMRGLEAVNIASLWEGAIVSEVFVWNVRAVPEAWDIRDSGWNVLFSNRVKPLDAKQEVSRMASKKPEAFLVQLAFSYGGSLAAVCDAVTFYELDGDVAQKSSNK